MKEEDKNRKKELSDFIKYEKREMTSQERNVFERKLQKDPFAEEAEEGFSGISPEEVERDLHLLNKQLKSRLANKPRRRLVYYSIAASIAMLMVISSVYILSEKNLTSEKTAEIALNQTPMEIPSTKAIILPEVPPSSENIILPEKTVEKRKAAVDKEVRSVSSLQADKTAVPSAIAEDRIDNAEIRKDDMIIISDSVHQEPTVFLAAADTESKEEVNLTPSELNEVVVVGYGVAKRSKAGDGVVAAENKGVSSDTGYAPPSPVDGKENFDKYIENKLRNPESLPEGKRAVVVLTFVVKSSGVIDNFKVIRSQGQEYSDEAIRLLKEGPAWNPAEENGQKIDDEVRIRIVFK